ncbi:MULTISPECIES: DNA replication/repair protein RecF [Leptospira]|uniref:DNA replication and repair protein RecF n=2 Tax=Leptospira borgpetersenii TaxID=174 RepID=A0ABP2S1K8_LEPBO|nr:MULTISPECIES: DNA replication/repair protein RecF [Leptospira]AXX14185.1 DNA replication and repair protein RecF [Leptospira borgpetersenii serovar Ceylonica]EKP12922.1 DNA replication and repair protein RecF [Leptospira borgpetersenii str. 200801926]EKQ91002.1 DNA replication and repair protein RecF [Leptospira borgpetersenii str. UI 09149]EMK14633.1 DNA replication and repair protein RecF [Leptospira sp. serovar Kenya str. Sh9]EMN59290.1 DNA replication and repair protein RecF [Leptospira
MFLKHLTLQNFRSYEELSLDFDSRLIFFVGDNGEGKTNLLEAICMLSWLKSFRESEDSNLIRWGSENYFLRGKIKGDQKESVLEVGFTAKPTVKRKLKFNQEEVKKRTDLIGKFITVLLTPMDLKIIEGGPAERRKFIDAFISSFDPFYLECLLEYNKILKHRNALLKTGISDASHLSIWDRKLIEKGVLILNKRKEIVFGLNSFYQPNLNKLSGGKDELEMIYGPNVKDKDEFVEKLSRNLGRDLRLGYTSVGIHRDDLFIGANKRDITEFGSQGQKRSTVIALKAATFNYYRNVLDTMPVLLIDDVIRELDVKRREYFVDLVINAGQAFFTTTDLEGIQDYVGKLEDQKQIFLIQQGNIQFAK